jgi:uncharacterized protein (DUF1501 family)
MLKLGACGAMTNATMLSTLLHLKLAQSVMADGPIVPPSGGYKALVCLFFQGAIDSFNILTPFGTTQNDPHYVDYVGTRSGAALRRTQAWDGAWTGTNYGYLHPIIDSAAAGGTGRTFGIHPRFSFLKQMYDAGHATFVANVGSLIEPVANNSEFSSKRLPIGLYSHSDQQRHWQSAVPTSRDQLRGWAGKMSDLLTDSSNAANATNVYSTISVSGQSQLLSGSRILPYSISSEGAVAMDGWPTASNAVERVFTAMQNDLPSQTYADLLERTVVNERLRARDAAAAFQSAFETTSLPGSPSYQFPNNAMGQSFSAIAKSIKLAQSPLAPLNQQRQTFLLRYGSWDHHANLLTSLDTMVPVVDQSLKAFYDFLIAENLLDKVTVFTISDFGRTWTYNGLGTDHAWGGNMFVMGGAVNGAANNNRIWGTYPNIVRNDNGPTGLDRGRGVIIPQLSTDAYHAELCRWFGVPNNQHLETILPNIRNFYSSSSTANPIGFLNPI